MKACKLLLFLWIIPLVTSAQSDSLLRRARESRQNPVVQDEKGEVKPLSSYSAPATTAFDNFNAYSVKNNPLVSTSFTLASSCLLVSIQTYHWNNGRGKLPGNIKIQHTNGTVYGPWTVKGTPGSGGVANVFWTVYPNMAIPAGTYTVIDSDKATWSFNSQSMNKGFTKVVVRK